LSRDGERTVEHRQAHHFSLGDVWTVTFSFGGKKESARGIGDASFFPFAGEDVDRLVGRGMRVGWDRGTRMKLAQNGDPAGRFVFVQHQQFNAGIRSGLPFLVLCKGRVLKHETS
jgi:hypothetical protein